MNITDPIRGHAARTPEAPAVVHAGTTYTYRDLDRLIDRFAMHARSLGARAGNTAAISVASPYAQLALSLALARVGVASAPATLPPEFVDICFASGERPVGRRYARIEIIDTVPPDFVGSEDSGAPIASHQDGSATCVVFASSGTTGFPKHVAISHALLARRITAKALLAPLPSGVRQLCPHSATGGYGFRDLLRVLWAGGSINLANKSGDVVAALQRDEANYLVASPAMLESIVSALPEGAGPFPSLTTIEVGGSQLPAALCELVRRRLCADVRSSYGATETGSVAAAPVERLLGRSGAVGYLVPGVDAEAVDENDRPLPPGAEGIVRIRSELCVDHYLGDPDATAISFRDGWFYPGDIGSVSSDRVLSIAGRVNEVINSGGVKVSPQAIEDVLLSVPEIRDAAAFGVADDAGQIQIWAAIVPNGTIDVSALEAKFRRRLRNAAPKYIIQLARLPRNEGGKVLRDELVRLARQARNVRR